jgi:hypothetical protein
MSSFFSAALKPPLYFSDAMKYSGISRILEKFRDSYTNQRNYYMIQEKWAIKGLH